MISCPLYYLLLVMEAFFVSIKDLLITLFNTQVSNIRFKSIITASHHAQQLHYRYQPKERLHQT